MLSGVMQHGDSSWDLVVGSYESWSLEVKNWIPDSGFGTMTFLYGRYCHRVTNQEHFYLGNKMPVLE
jgi:hypothetical protein